MQLHQAGDPASVWQYSERYLGGGTRLYSRFSADLDIRAEFHPQYGSASFMLPTFVVPRDAGTLVRNGIDSALPDIYSGPEHLLLPVHPETLAFPDLHARHELTACEAGPPIEVVPSANARTVFVTSVGGKPTSPHFLKLHYPKRLSRFTRRLRRQVIQLQLWVSGEFGRARLPVLPEVAGGFFGEHPIEAWGFVVREFSTPGSMPGVYTVPLFALYGRDHLAPNDPTLIEQLVRESGEDPIAYIGEQVIGPMIRLWWRIVLSTGCVPEMHGQNTLFQFTVDGVARGIAYRDCATYVDPLIRQDLGFPDLPEINVISRDVVFSRDRIFSLAYDSFMGHHALDFLADVAYRAMSVPPDALRAVARRAFAEAAPVHSLLPKTAWYYDNILRDNGKWNLVDTLEEPNWR